MVEVAVVEETEKQEAVVEVVEEVLAAALVVLVVDIVGVIDMSIRIQKKCHVKHLPSHFTNFDGFAKIVCSATAAFGCLKTLDGRDNVWQRQRLRTM